jgi:hypothetical protein
MISRMTQHAVTGAMFTVSVIVNSSRVNSMTCVRTVQCNVIGYSIRFLITGLLLDMRRKATVRQQVEFTSCSTTGGCHISHLHSIDPVLDIS